MGQDALREHPMLAWWLAQLDDIEAVALAAKPGRWRAVGGGGDAPWDQAYVDPRPDGGQPWGSGAEPAHRRWRCGWC